MSAKNKTAEPEESALSLSFRGALPEILRKIADRIDSGEVSAESFTSRVSRESFELSASINLRP